MNNSSSIFKNWFLGVFPGFSGLVFPGCKKPGNNPNAYGYWPKSYELTGDKGEITIGILLVECTRIRNDTVTLSLNGYIFPYLCGKITPAVTK